MSEDQFYRRIFWVVGTILFILAVMTFVTRFLSLKYDWREGEVYDLPVPGIGG